MSLRSGKHVACHKYLRPLHTDTYRTTEEDSRLGHIFRPRHSILAENQFGYRHQGIQAGNRHAAEIQEMPGQAEQTEGECERCQRRGKRRILLATLLSIREERQSCQSKGMLRQPALHTYCPLARRCIIRSALSDGDKAIQRGVEKNQRRGEDLDVARKRHRGLHLLQHHTHEQSPCAAGSRKI